MILKNVRRQIYLCPCQFWAMGLQEGLLASCWRPEEDRFPYSSGEEIVQIVWQRCTRLGDILVLVCIKQPGTPHN